ncbi:heme peroxidase [Armillaria solidipes]|uniref:Peroxidase n=1 Tax=Armillaria solidipes TaxID=1076256 RepID=A0A2H3BNE6_9AGAR|nr:heme peroxidase [Armillaria solidipes]
MHTLERSLVLLAFLAGIHAYTWPSNIDYLEGVMYQQAGYRRFGIIDGVNPRSFNGGLREGRQAAAEWVRPDRFHDMITHNAADGTGGLDASIMFETERPENPGGAFNETLDFLNNLYNIQTSMADLLAMGLSVSVRSCGGPRIDATNAGPEGVPEPTDDLSSIAAQFATAGFNTTEMIQMVACGHSLGGVYGVDFPDITGDNSSTNFVHFDSSFSSFDSAPSPTLDGTTENPLAVGPDTSNSDLLVFSADGNVTMRSLSDEASFRNTCQDIHVVPSSVTLSDIIEPIPIMPVQLQMTFDSSGSFTFTGEIHVLLSGRDNKDLTVQLRYVDHDGKIPSTNNTISTEERHSTGYDFNAEFKFLAAVPNGISSSTYLLRRPLEKRRHAIMEGPDEDENGNWNLTVVAAVRNENSLKNPTLDVAVMTEPAVRVPSIAVESSAMEVWNMDA